MSLEVFLVRVGGGFFFGERSFFLSNVFIINYKLIK